MSDICEMRKYYMKKDHKLALAEGYTESLDEYGHQYYIMSGNRVFFEYIKANDACMSEICEICNGDGWVCENHPNLPQGHDQCGGAGDPCICNPGADARFTEIIAEVKDNIS